MITNKEQLERWLTHLYSNNYQLRRYNNFQLKDLEMDYVTELKKHAVIWKQNPTHFTFHHLRNLFINLQQHPILYPMVGTVRNNEIGVDPGGSRLMVSKYLGNIANTILDLICEKQFSIKGSYDLINDVDTFCCVYDKSPSDYFVQTFRDDPKVCAIDQPGWQKNDY